MFIIATSSTQRNPVLKTIAAWVYTNTVPFTAQKKLSKIILNTSMVHLLLPGSQEQIYLKTILDLREKAV